MVTINFKASSHVVIPSHFQLRVFGIAMRYSDTNEHQIFEGRCCLHLQCQIEQESTNQEAEDGLRALFLPFYILVFLRMQHRPGGYSCRKKFISMDVWGGGGGLN